MPHLVAVENGKIIGIGMLYISHGRRRHIGELGIMIREEYYGRGVCTKLLKAILDLADNWHKLHRLQLEVYTDNKAAIKLYKKFGFEVKGT